MELDTASVMALLKLAGLRVSEARVADIAAQLERIRTVAAPLLAAPLEPADEQAPVWRP